MEEKSGAVSVCDRMCMCVCVCVCVCMNAKAAGDFSQLFRLFNFRLKETEEETHLEKYFSTAQHLDSIYIIHYF